MFDNSDFGKYSSGSPTITYDRVQPLLKWVYAWMGLGLLITTFVAFFTATTPALLEIAMTPGVLIGALITEFVLVLALTWGLQRMSPALAGVLFMVYAAINGFVFSLLLIVYTTGSITAAFATAALLFGVMSVFAFTTNIDLTKWGSYLMMGLIGLVIAMVVNFFLRSTAFELIISMFGVVLFTGLTAYDTQKIKLLAASPELQADGTLTARMAIFGALRLYLDFVNLFLFLLRLLGRRR